MDSLFAHAPLDAGCPAIGNSEDALLALAGGDSREQQQGVCRLDDSWLLRYDKRSISGKNSFSKMFLITSSTVLSTKGE